jgi:hypothetical protein
MLFDLISQATGGDNLQKISRNLGADEQTTGNAVSSALPLLLGALTRNASSDSGAESLFNALEKDHNGSILDNVGSSLESSQSGAGDGILRHVLGGKRSTVESAISQSSGLDLASVGKLLTMLAPLVMGGLGRLRQDEGLDMGGLSSLLKGEMQNAERTGAAPSGLLSMLDADSDGEIVDDLANLGKGILGNILGRK